LKKKVKSFAGISKNNYNCKMNEQSLKDNEIKALISLLDDTDKEVYHHIEERLLSLGREAIPVLENAWSNSFDALLQQRIEHIVHKIQLDSLKEDLKLWIHVQSDNLLQGAILVARYQYPDLDDQKVYEGLNKIKRDIWLEVNENMTALEQINIINHILFVSHGFSGNTSNYHAPQNSFINSVLETKKGNPLSLGIIYMLLCQQLGLPVYGVNLPEHFVLAYIDKATEFDPDEIKILFYINAFSKGTVFGKTDVEDFIRKLNLKPKSEYFLPCSHTDMMLRMLRNVASSFQKLGDVEKVAELNTLIRLFGAAV
jgi:regulator of sirC expression with transglutaminase-like and TPR domain